MPQLASCVAIVCLTTPLHLACQRSSPANAPSGGAAEGPTGAGDEAAAQHYEDGRRALSSAGIKVGYKTYDHALLDRARASFKAALALAPTNAEYLYWLARTEDCAGREGDGLACLEQLLALAPDHAAGNRLLGKLLAQRGELERAEGVLRRAVELDPADAESWVELGALAEERRELVQARQCYEQALGITPWISSAHFRLGSLLYQLAENERAQAEIDLFQHYLGLEQELDRALRSARETASDPDSLLAVGDCYLALEQPRASRMWAERALGIAPQHPGAHHLMGMALGAEGDLEGAIAHLRTAVHLAPNEPALRGDLAWKLYAAGRAERAVEVMRKAVELDGSSALGLVQLGLLQREMHEYAAARRSFEQALSRDETSVQAHLGLAEVLYELALVAEAAEHYRKVLELDPENAAARNSLRVVTGEAVGR